jgi:hypothetical protein
LQTRIEAEGPGPFMIGRLGGGMIAQQTINRLVQEFLYVEATWS